MFFSFILLIAFSINLFAINLTDFINKENCDQIIDKQVYIICYDYNMKGARYVSYTLDGNKVNTVNIKKRSSFYTEKNLPKKYRSHTKDYTHSGYDRGHLANDASFDYDEKVVRKTYTMANIIPQAPKVNRKTWIKAEKLERKIAASLGSVNVLNGVVYSSNPKRIGKNKIAVPDAFWKMIYNDDKNYKKCFYYKNDLDAVSKGDKLKNHQIDCERLK
jgi:endonuclease G